MIHPPKHVRSPRSPSPPPTAYAERHVGLTFGGVGASTEARLTGSLKAGIGGVSIDEPAPAELEAHADATWGDRNVYGLLLTYAGVNRMKRM